MISPCGERDIKPPEHFHSRKCHLCVNKSTTKYTNWWNTFQIQAQCYSNASVQSDGEIRFAKNLSCWIVFDGCGTETVWMCDGNSAAVDFTECWFPLTIVNLKWNCHYYAFGAKVFQLTKKKKKLKRKNKRNEKFFFFRVGFCELSFG